jgi:hypothetical protein
MLHLYHIIVQYIPPPAQHQTLPRPNRSSLNRFRAQNYVITLFSFQAMADAFTYYRSRPFSFTVSRADPSTGDRRSPAFSGPSGSGSPRPSGAASTPSCSGSPVPRPTPPTSSGSPLACMRAQAPTPPATASPRRLSLCSSLPTTPRYPFQTFSTSSTMTLARCSSPHASAGPPSRDTLSIRFPPINSPPSPTPSANG